MNLEEALKLSEELEAKAPPGDWFISELNNHIAINMKNEMRKNGHQRVCGSIVLKNGGKLNPAQVSNFHLIVHARNTHKLYVETIKVLMRACHWYQMLGPDMQEGIVLWDGGNQARTALETVRRLWEGE